MLATAVLLCGVLAATPPAAAPSPGNDAEIRKLVSGLPATLERLIIAGPGAVAALRQAAAEAPPARKAVLVVALAAALNQEGDSKGAREALKELPKNAIPDLAARAAYEDALAGEQAGEKNAPDLYERAAAGKCEAVSVKALMRLAVLHKFAGRFPDARKALERAMDIAETRAKPIDDGGKPAGPPAEFDELRMRASDAGAGLDRFAETARTLRPPAGVPDRWRPRLMDTFAAPELTFPGYDRWFRDGKMHVYGDPDRFTSISLGLYSGGGPLHSEHLTAEFALRLRKAGAADGKWRMGFAVRTGHGRAGVLLHAAESRQLTVVAGEERLSPEAAVYRPRGTNVFRVVAVGRRVEIRVNGLPLEVILDAPDARGGLDLLALGCSAECDWCRILVPGDPSAPAADADKAWALNAAALDDAAAGRTEAALDKFTELAPSVALDCESRLYLFRLMRSHGGERHLKMLAELWPDKIDRHHWFAAEQARLSLMGRWADPALRPAFADIAKSLNERKHEEALRLLNGILAKSPGLFPALDARAEAHKIAGDLAKSAEDCEAALKADPKALSPLLRLAWLERRKGDAAAEVKALERVLAAFPKLPEALRMMEEARRKLRPRKPRPAQLTLFDSPFDVPSRLRSDA